MKHFFSHINISSLLKSIFPFTLILALGACATHEMEEEHESPRPAISAATEDLRRSSKFSSLTENIRFGFASAELTPTSKLALDEIADEMKKTADSYNKVRIVGFTDPSGHSDRNQRLSQARANTAKDYLISRGVPADKVEAIGRGPMESIKGTSAQEARARRVDFEIIE